MLEGQIPRADAWGCEVAVGDADYNPSVSAGAAATA
jgi:hypothetical protein